jgi:hypothetical protein
MMGCGFGVGMAGEGVSTLGASVGMDVDVAGVVACGLVAGEYVEVSVDVDAGRTGVWRAQLASVNQPNSETIRQQVYL